MIALLVRGAAIGVFLGTLATLETVHATPELHAFGPAFLFAGPLVLFHVALICAISIFLFPVRAVIERLGIDLPGLGSDRFLWTVAAFVILYLVGEAFLGGHDPSVLVLRQVFRVSVGLASFLVLAGLARRSRFHSARTVEWLVAFGIAPATLATFLYTTRTSAPLPAEAHGVDVVSLSPRFAPEAQPLLRAEGGQPRTKMLVVGLDGASWDRIDAGIEAGGLPTFARLVRGGVRAPLETLVPTSSPAIWTTMVTGVPPEVHGITEFHLLELPRLGVHDLRLPRHISSARRFLETIGEIRHVPVTTSLRRSKAIWNLADEAALRSAVVGFWASWPPEPLQHGFVVSDHASVARRYEWLSRGRLRSTEDSATVWPLALGPRLERFQRDPTSVTREELTRFLPVDAPLWAEFERVPHFSKGEKLSAFRSSHLNDEFFLRAGLHLWTAERLDLLIVYARAIDELCHFFYEAGAPDAADLGVPAEEITRYHGIVDAIYRWTDAELKPYLDEVDADPNALLVVLSDHGWSKQSDGSYGHREAPPGILVFYGGGVCTERCSPLARASVYDIAPTILERLGLPISAELVGRPLVEAFITPRPQLRVASYGRSLGNHYAIPSPDDPAQYEKLQALGYVQ